MSKYYKADDVVSKIVNTPTKVITDDLTALADRQHEIIDMLEDLPTIEVSEDDNILPLLGDEYMCEDAISREDAVNALIAHFIPQTYTGEQVEQASKLAWKIMANAPSVIPQPKEGEWYNDTRYTGWTCTHCGYHDGNKTDNYCPDCGAKMKGTDNE